MSEKNLKIVPAPAAAPEAKVEAKTRPGEQAAGEAPHRARRKRPNRKQLRTILLIAVPAIAIVLGGAFWLMGGRYISTDNAYVGAQKVLITPDISGKIVHVAIVEGQHVNSGDVLFTLDALPYKLALDAAKGKLDAARIAVGTLASEIAARPRSVERVVFCCFATESAEHHKDAFAELGLV